MAEIIRKTPTNDEDMEELIETVVQTFERNEERYKGKSDQWLIRITADELGMRKDDMLDILDKFYGEK